MRKNHGFVDYPGWFVALPFVFIWLAVFLSLCSRFERSLSGQEVKAGWRDHAQVMLLAGGGATLALVAFLLAWMLLFTALVAWGQYRERAWRRTRKPAADALLDRLELDLRDRNAAALYSDLVELNRYMNGATGETRVRWHNLTPEAVQCLFQGLPPDEFRRLTRLRHLLIDREVDAALKGATSRAT